MNDSRARLVLSLLAEPGDARMADARRRTGGAAALLEALHADPDRWPRPWTERLREAEDHAERVATRGASLGLRWITPADAEWPAQLDDLDHVEPAYGVGGAPLGLWCRGPGELTLLVHHALAVVGARDCTTYGADVATDIAAAGAEAGFTVVSGAAFGIDASAHRGALSAGDPGIAVLACGPDQDYPRAHASLLRRVAERGVVVAEYPPGERVTRSRFLARNRLIAALVEGLVVVEAARRSGSLNTLHWADRLGRVTMAVPGPITSAHSQGTHEAIRSGKAVLVGSGSDVVAELLGFSGQVDGQGLEFDPLATAVAAALSAAAPRDLGALASELSAGTHPILRALRRLEAAGAVRAVTGGWVLVETPAAET